MYVLVCLCFYMHAEKCLDYAPINVKPAQGGGGGGGQGMGWGFDCLCWPWGRAFDWSCSPGGGNIWILLRPTWGYLTADSEERDWDRAYVSRFHASRMHYRSGKSGKSWRPLTRASERWVDFTVLSSNFVCFSVFLFSWTLKDTRVPKETEVKRNQVDFCKYNWSVFAAHSLQSP